MTQENYDYTAPDADPDIDWSTGQAKAAPDKVTVKADAYEIDDVDTGVDADAVAREADERQSFPICPGIYRLKVVGFFGDPAQVVKQLFVQGQPYQMTSFGVTVKFALPEDTHFQIGDYFILPPIDPRDLSIYQQGTSSATSDFNWAKKFGHFLNRLYPGLYPTGSTRMPSEARKLINWVGRSIYAEVEAQRESNTKINPRTGQPYPPKNQIKMFSYNHEPFAHRKPPNSGGSSPRPGGFPGGHRPLAGQQSLPMGTANSSPVQRPQTGPAPAAQVKNTGLGAI